MNPQRVLKTCSLLIIITAVFVLIRIGSRIFVGDWFPVNTTSMVPVIIPGDKIWVNKLIFGARIYKNLNFFEGKPLETFRVKGWRKIRRGDVVVFNAPIPKSGGDSILFSIDYVFVKRCVGLPGDTATTFGSQRYSGSIYVPKKGDTIYMDHPKWHLYQTIIAYENKGVLPKNYHVFQNNYYFMCGDNTLQSHDSRDFGFVPEEFIIGVSKRVLFNNHKGWRQNRIFYYLSNHFREYEISYPPPFLDSGCVAGAAKESLYTGRFDLFGATFVAECADCQEQLPRSILELSGLSGKFVALFKPCGYGGGV